MELCMDTNPNAIQPVCIEINRFANLCGHFYNAYLTDNVSANNGYNCRHPEQSEVVVEDGKKTGCCFCWSCPLGYRADTDDLVRFGIISEDERPEDEHECATEDDYIVVTDAAAIKKLRERGIA